MTRLSHLMLAAAAAAILTHSPAAHAQAAACGPRDAIVEALDGKYAERRLGAGLQPGRGVIEVYASESGTWTLLLTLPNGASCVLAAGEAWSGPAPAPPGDPA